MATIKTISPSRVRTLTKQEWREMTSGQRWNLGICVGAAALFLNAGLPGTAPPEVQGVQGTLKPAAEVVLPADAKPSETTNPVFSVTAPGVPPGGLPSSTTPPQAASAPADEQSTSPPPDTTPKEPSPKPQPAPGLVPQQLLHLLPQQLLDLLGSLGVL
jgi:hypothetical protein